MLEFIYRKGVAMLVSAISANGYNIAIHKNPNKTQSDKKADKKTDTAFNSLSSQSKHAVNDDKARIYGSINEWKDFCHKQIINGNLDVIA